MKRKLSAAAVAMVVLVAGGAYAAASSGSTTTTTPSTSTSMPNQREAFLADVASRLGVSTATLEAALKGAFEDRLTAAVSAGRLTQAQASEIEKHLSSGAPLPFGMWLGAGMPFAMRMCHGAPCPPPNTAIHVPFGAGGALGFGFGFRIGLGLHHEFKAAADYLGLTPEKLLSELRSGRSPAQIAAAQGKSLDGLHAAMVQALSARLDRAVKAGVLTQAQANKILARRSAAMSALLSGKALTVAGAARAWGRDGEHWQLQMHAGKHLSVHTSKNGVTVWSWTTAP